MFQMTDTYHRSQENALLQLHIHLALVESLFILPFFLPLKQLKRTDIVSLKAENLMVSR